MNELEKFVEEHKDTFEKFQRINEACEEEMEKIQKNKLEHPELFDLDYQLDLTNKFIAENPEINVVELKEKERKK